MTERFGEDVLAAFDVGWAQGVSDTGARLIACVAAAVEQDDPLLTRLIERLGQIVQIGPTGGRSDLGAFGIGDLVDKPRGYAFPGVVRSVFVTGAGEVRTVAESEASPGLLHIFAPDQLRLREKAL